MQQKSRRTVVIVSALAALTATTTAWVSAAFGTATLHQRDIRYIGDPKSPAISFDLARKRVSTVVADELSALSAEFGTKYTSDQVEQIHAQIWDSAQLSLLTRYRPKEQPKLGIN